MKFTLKDTNILKGVGILFMYFHHFYLSPDRYEGIDISFFPFTEHQVITVAEFLKICVSLFVFMSGYGMYASYKKRKEDVTFKSLINYSKNRYVKLIMNYMFIFLLSHLVFLYTGRIFEIYKLKYESVIYFVIDMFGLAHFFGTPTYLGTWWYISLISLIIFFFPVIFKCFHKNIIIYMLTVCIIPQILGVEEYFLFRYLPSFSFGMIFAQYDLFVKIRNMLYSDKIYINILLFLLGLVICYLLIIYRRNGMFSIGIRDAIVTSYYCLFIYLFIARIPLLSDILSKLGEHSMTMFLTHTFVRTTFFHSFSYGFYNAFLNIFIFVIVTYISSYIIDNLRVKIGFDKLINKVCLKLS